MLSVLIDNYRLSELNDRPYWTRGRRNTLTNAVEAAYQLLAIDAGYSGLSDTYRGSSPREVMTRAGIALGDQRYVLGRLSAEDAFLVTRDRLTWAGEFQAQIVPDRGPAYALSDSGYYMLRGSYWGSPMRSADQLIFDAGPRGGSHGHYDLFSFELQEMGVDTPIPDPGPYAYDDSADRQWAISTPAHNTISIDGKNHEAVEGAGNPKVVVDKFDLADDYQLITAHHHAYEYLAGRPTVGRTVWMEHAVKKPYSVVLLVDWVRSDPAHPHAVTTSLNFQDRTVTQAGPGAYDVQLTNTLKMRVNTISPKPFTAGVTDSFISDYPPPDAKTPGKRYAATQTGSYVVFVTAISMYSPGGFTPRSAAVVEFDQAPVDGQPVKVKLTMTDGAVRRVTFAPPDLRPLASTPSATPFGTVPIAG